MAGRLPKRKRGNRPAPSHPGAGRRSAIWFAVGVIASTLAILAWQRSSGATAKAGSEKRIGTAATIPLLRLECAGLGIGTGQGAIALILDAAGVIRTPQETAAAALPPFVFEPVQGIVIGRPGPEPVFDFAVRIARKWRPAWEERLGPVTGMTAQGGCGVTVETAGEVTVQFLAEDLDRQFRNLTWIWRQTQKEGREIATVNLIPEHNVPVTFRVERP